MTEFQRTEPRIDLLREGLVDTFSNGNQALVTEATIRDWVGLDVPLVEKYKGGLNVHTLLHLNYPNKDWAEVMVQGLGTIEKYGTRLLTSAVEHLPHSWQYVDFDKPSTKKKLGGMQGTDLILKTMGYTENTSTGIKFAGFPQSVDTRRSTIATVTASVILIKSELEMYLKGKHPFPDRITNCQAESLSFHEVQLPNDGTSGDINTAGSPVAGAEDTPKPPANVANKEVSGPNLLQLQTEPLILPGTPQNETNTNKMILSAINDSASEDSIEQLKYKIENLKEKEKVMRNETRTMMLEDDDFQNSAMYKQFEKKLHKIREEYKTHEEHLDDLTGQSMLMNDQNTSNASLYGQNMMQQSVMKQNNIINTFSSNLNVSQISNQFQNILQNEHNVEPEHTVENKDDIVTDWECSSCSFTNDVSANDCECCGIPKHNEQQHMSGRITPNKAESLTTPNNYRTARGNEQQGNLPNFSLPNIDFLNLTNNERGQTKPQLQGQIQGQHLGQTQFQHQDQIQGQHRAQTQGQNQGQIQGQHQGQTQGQHRGQILGQHQGQTRFHHRGQTQGEHQGQTEGQGQHQIQQQPKDDMRWNCSLCWEENSCLTDTCLQCNNPRKNLDTSQREIGSGEPKVNVNLAALVPGSQKDLKKMEREKTEEIMSQGSFDEDLVRYMLYVCNGDADTASDTLCRSLMQPFIDNYWEGLGITNSSGGHNISQQTSGDSLNNPTFVDNIKDKNLPKERRLRMAMFEGEMNSWVSAQIALSHISNPEMLSKGVTVRQILEACKDGTGDLEAIKARMMRDCEICGETCAFDQIHQLTLCMCQICTECFVRGYKVKIRQEPVIEMTCLFCKKPDMSTASGEIDMHLQILGNLIQNLMDDEHYQLFTQKLAEWNISNTGTSGYCSNPECSSPFTDLPPGKFQCRECKQYTCGTCKKQWEDDHENRTCREYENYKLEKTEMAGIGKRLDEEGIECPSCNHRYFLAKGGCMHFTCTQCKHEFCSGCNNPFRRGQDCLRKLESCGRKGLHCHHPRDCLFYLRDNDVKELEDLLQRHNKPFNENAEGAVGGEGAVAGEGAAAGEEPTACQIQEMKEPTEGVFQDEPCGEEVQPNQRGMCEAHYKEYLIQLINVNLLDPIDIMSTQEVIILLKREEVDFRAKAPGEADDQYGGHLKQVVKQRIPNLCKTKEII